LGFFRRNIFPSYSIIWIARSSLFLYLIGIISAAQITFLSEKFFPLSVSKLEKSLIITVFIPFIFIFGGIYTGKGSMITEVRTSKSNSVSKVSIFSKFDWIIVAIIMFGIWAGGYFLVGKLSLKREMHTLMLDMDRMIPFDPYFVWLYLTIYPAFLVPFFYIDKKSLVKMVMHSYITVLILSYFVFLLYPVYYPRPQLVETDFSTWALSLVYKGDPQWNCFPSTHCAMALMAALVLLEANVALGIWGIIIALSIGISTLIIKQHYIVDIFAGYGITLLVYYLYFKERVIDILGKKQKELTRKFEIMLTSKFEDVVRKVVREELKKYGIDENAQNIIENKKIKNNNEV